ncbi:Pol I core factor CF [Ascosphaera acerosa]|nr:Pol I core factor CF [Ascosphaera acerosa]
MEQIIRGQTCPVEGCAERYYGLYEGIWYCRQGHRQEGREVIVDDENFGSLGRVIKKQRAPSERSSRTYSGSDAYQLFLEAYQVILWKQGHALVHEKGLPAELETIVKGLWALRLQMLTRHEDQYLSESTASHSFSSRSHSQSRSRAGTETGTRGSTRTTTALTAEEDAYHARKVAASPKLIDSLALWYLGCVLLRLPVSAGYLLRWALRDQVPLLRALRHVPRAMRDRLPHQYHRVLDTPGLPTGDALHAAASRLARLFRREHSVVWPPLNAPLLQLAYVRELCLPLEVFQTVTSLRDVVRCDLCFGGASGRSMAREVRSPLWPELQLLSLLVVAVKLLYPFRDGDQQPAVMAHSPSESALARLDWKHWQMVQESRAAQMDGRIGPEQALLVTEADALTMSEQQMDDYLEWYERMFTSGQGERSDHPIADMFPIKRPGTAPAPPSFPPSETTAADITAVMQKLQPRTSLSQQSHSTAPSPPPFDSAEQPGSVYRRYQTEEDLASDAAVARYFHEQAARVVGVSLKALLAGVYAMETRVLKWLAAHRGEVLAGLGHAVDAQRHQRLPVRRRSLRSRSADNGGR